MSEQASVKSTSAATAQVSRTPWWFYLVAILAILWNSGGVMDFTMTHTQNEAYMANFTAEQQAYFFSFPLWANIAWAFGVFGAFVGSLLLLFRTRFAFHAFLLSLLGMILSFAYQFVSDAPDDLYTPATMGFTLAIWIVALLLLWYSKRMTKKGLLK
uniref:hypothetical protein n=1 Tax=Ningiella ruwaisensis TaxID=2364274 RepID=UPI00109F8671|nr:hypothetical protein [Ningiella ruwaisensis]